MSLLYEYGRWTKTTHKVELKSFLRNIWQQRLLEQPEADKAEEIDNHYQPFLQFDDDQIRANNYVGFIQNGNELIEIYPKVFKNVAVVDRALMLRHIFYWFSYCRKWKFPFTQSSLQSVDIDRFPELIIHLIATQFLETVSERPLMQYQMQVDALTSPRGSINFTRYINQGASKGNFHKLECDYEPFLFDNRVNRIIKYCTRLLLSQTRLAENQRLLQETLFVLDEVEDIPCTVHHINMISLSSFYEDYSLIMGVCKNIVEQQMYSNNEYDLSQWCLLFPMEYIFEDFVAGFLQTHFSEEWRVEDQKSNAYLVSNPEVFRMQHDIFLTHLKTGRKIIVDTKYKLRHFVKGDLKSGVSQNDLYQVTSYALRRGCTEVILLYPNISEDERRADLFQIESGFAGKEKICVTVVDIPFWSMRAFGNLNSSLVNSFNELLNTSRQSLNN